MRWIFRLIGLLVVLALLALAGLFLIPSERIAALAAKRFEAATGRALVIKGAVSPTVWPVLGVTTGAVEIANAGWSKAGPMLSAEGLEIGVDPLALIRGEVRVIRIEAKAPKIVLERRKDGVGNWVFSPDAGTGGAAAGAAKGGTAPSPALKNTAGDASGITLDHGTIRDGTLTWIDGISGQKLTLDKIAAEVSLPDYAGPMTLKLSGQMNGQPVAVEGRIATFSAFLSGAVVPVKVSASVAGSPVGFDGKAGVSPVQAQGGFSADLAGPGAVFALAGMAAPALPEGLGRRTISAKGQVTYGADGLINMRGATLALDGNQIAGDADIALAGARPKVTAKLSAGALNLAALGGGGASAGKAAAGGAAAPAAAQAGWSTAPIDASALSAIDANVTLTADSIDLGAAKFGRTKAQVQIDNGRAVIGLNDVQAYQGQLTGQVVVNGRGGLSASSDLKAANVALQPLLGDLAGYRRLIGTGSFTVQAGASGNSVAALVKTLAGQGTIALGKGELDGLDLVGMMTHLDANFVGDGAKTIFDKVTASYTIKAGVLSNSDLAVSSGLLKATGKGWADIAQRTLDYTAIPTALAKADGTGGVTVPLRINGRWAAPSFTPDLSGLAEQKLLNGQSVKDAATKAVGDKLGLQPNPGESVEDAAKRKLKDEAAKGLLNLLQGN